MLCGKRWAIEMLPHLKTELLLKEVQGVHEKLCFFTIYCNASLAYIAVRPLQSSQRNASVKSLLLVIFCTTNSAGEGEVANFREFLEKSTIFNEHPVPNFLLYYYYHFGNNLLPFIHSSYIHILIRIFDILASNGAIIDIQI